MEEKLEEELRPPVVAAEALSQPRLLAMFLLLKEPRRLVDLTDYGIPKSTANRWLKRLVGFGFANRVRGVRGRYYYLSDEGLEVLKLIGKHIIDSLKRLDIGSKYTEKLKRLMEERSVYGYSLRRYRSHESQEVEKVIRKELLSEVFEFIKEKYRVPPHLVTAIVKISIDVDEEEESVKVNYALKV